MAQETVAITQLGHEKVGKVTSKRFMNDSADDIYD